MIQNCPVYGKGFEIMWPHLWAYKRNSQYICSWKCLRANDKTEGEDKMKLSERDQKAVDIALEGGSPVAFLKAQGSKNPGAAWYNIKLKVKQGDVETYNKIQAARQKKPEPTLADAMTGMKDAADTFFGQCEDMGLKLDKQEELKVFQPVKYDGMTVREIEGGFGRYRRSDVHDSTYIDFEYTEGADVISLTDKQWRSFMEELIHAAEILGVKL